MIPIENIYKGLSILIRDIEISPQDPCRSLADNHNHCSKCPLNDNEGGGVRGICCYLNTHKLSVNLVRLKNEFKRVSTIYAIKELL